MVYRPEAIASYWKAWELQQIMSGRILLNMAKELGRETDLDDLQEEVDYLTQFVNDKMWNEKTHFSSTDNRRLLGLVSRCRITGTYEFFPRGVG